ncbi:MAG: UDP-glucose 4-epimerase GalE [Planctomycetota bacterium]|nr:UDP-glucose 4-epimerase GalE [Planctomycetota bacterium]
MRILVTGGAGYIGSHTVRALVERGDRVVVLDNLSTGHRDATRGAELVVGDLRDGSAVRRALRRCRAESVVHFAAKALVPESVRHPEEYFDVNVVGGLTLLREMTHYGVKKIVFSSSAAVYGEPRARLIHENLPYDPINPYGETKALFEKMLKAFCAAFGVGSISLRYFNAAGAAPDGALGERHDHETHVIPLVLRAALNPRKRFSIFGTDYPTPDGTCVRDFVHVCDLADAHMLALGAVRPGKCEVYNLGCGHGYSVREVVETAKRVTGRPIRIAEGRCRPGDPPRLVASSQKIRKRLGWKPRHASLESIIRDAWRFELAGRR